MELQKEAKQVEVSSRKCKEHPEFDVEFLLINKIEESVLKCPMCFNESVFKREELLQLRLIERANEHTIFQFYPINNNDISDKLRMISKHQKGDVNNRISSFFKQFRAEILDSLDRIEQEIMTELDSVDSLQDSLINEYNKLSQKSSLIDLLAQKEILLEDLNEKIKKIIDSVNEQQNRNLSNLSSQISSFQQMNQKIESKRSQLAELKGDFLSSLANQLNMSLKQVGIFGQPAKNPPLFQSYNPQNSLFSPVPVLGTMGLFANSK